MNNVEIIVSRYNETLDWMKEYPFNQFKYTIYNKGNNNIFYKPNNCEIINLPNIGRCDHTYFYHIVKNYNNLATISIFFPGSVNMNNKIKKAKLILKFYLSHNIAIFPVEYCNDIYKKFNYFLIEKWEASYILNKNSVNSKIDKAKIRPFGKWYKYHFGNKICKYYSINSIFALHKSDIIKYPLSRYIHFEKLLNSSTHPEVCHYIERSWGAIFGPMLETKLFNYV